MHMFLSSRPRLMERIFKFGGFNIETKFGRFKRLILQLEVESRANETHKILNMAGQEVIKVFSNQR